MNMSKACIGMIFFTTKRPLLLDDVCVCSAQGEHAFLLESAMLCCWCPGPPGTWQQQAFAEAIQ
jgi:hypothetical protein